MNSAKGPLLPVLDIYRAVRRSKWIACLFFQTLSSFSFHPPPPSREILENSSFHLLSSYRTILVVPIIKRRLKRFGVEREIRIWNLELASKFR